MGRLDGGFWAHHFRRVFARQVRVFGTAVAGRLLPTFENLDSEADQLADSIFAGERERPYAEDYGDLADLAAEAEDESLDYYLELTAVRQSVLNFGAASLYHLIEQQMLLFHRRQVLHPSAEDDHSQFHPRKVRQALSEAGVELESLPSWRTVLLLEILANTIKHGDGPSADKLRAQRPEFLVAPALRGQHGGMGGPTPYVRLPLAGESVYVTDADFAELAGAAEKFWLELADAIDPAVTGGV